MEGWAAFRCGRVESARSLVCRECAKVRPQRPHPLPLLIEKGIAILPQLDKLASMSLDDLEKRIQAAEAAVATQGDTVRSLKAGLKDKSIEKVGAHDHRDPPPPLPTSASSRRAIR